VRLDRVSEKKESVARFKAASRKPEVVSLKVVEGTLMKSE